MENTKNPWKSKIMSSFLFVVFTYTVLHGGDRLIMKEGLELDCFIIIWCPSEHKRGVGRRQNPFFEN